MVVFEGFFELPKQDVVGYLEIAQKGIVNSGEYAAEDGGGWRPCVGDND